MLIEVYNCETQQLEWIDADESDFEEIERIGNCPECFGHGVTICDEPCTYCGGKGNVWWDDMSVTIPEEYDADRK